jgi:hypothetical protein
MMELWELQDLDFNYNHCDIRLIISEVFLNQEELLIFIAHNLLPEVMLLMQVQTHQVYTVLKLSSQPLFLDNSNHF